MSRKMFLGFALCFCVLIGLLSLSSISHTEEGKWTKKADMPTARAVLSTSEVDGKIYAIGGTSPWPIAISTVEEYDPATDTWTKKADVPTARGWLSTSVVNGKIYAIGGGNKPDEALSTVEEYDPTTDTWTKKADMPTARRYFSTSMVNGKIYAIGGWKDWGNNIDLSTVEEYDPAKSKWTKKADMPTARKGLSTSVVNGKIYAIGGSIGGGVVASRFASTVEEYNPATDKWTKKANTPTQYISYANVVNGKIYAIDYVNWVVEEYDPATDKWTKRTDVPLPKKWGFATGVVNGKIYVIGGGLMGPGDILTSTVEEYDTGLGIEAKGKLPTSWGKIKSKY